MDQLTCPAGTDWYNEDGSGFVDDGECKPTVLVTPTGQVGIGTTSPASTFEIASKTGGFLPPRMTTAERAALTPNPTSALEGLVVYNTEADQLEVYDGADWKAVAGASHGLKSFNIPGTYNFQIPDGVFSIQVEVWGGGGGTHGGFYNNGHSGGPGGGGGGYGKEVFPVTPGVTYEMKVGAGGTGIAGGPNGAEDGLESRFGKPGLSPVIVVGGRGARGYLGPGSGGTSTAPVNVSGTAGQSGESSQFNPGLSEYAGGNGGTGGNGGAGGLGGAPGDGLAGVAPGGGGGGGSCHVSGANCSPTTSGGNGAPGRVVISW